MGGRAECGLPAQPGQDGRGVVDGGGEAVLGAEAVVGGEDNGGELRREAEAAGVEVRLLEGPEAEAAAVEVHEHRQLLGGVHGRRRRPVHAQLEAVRGVVHDVLPLDARDVGEALGRPEDGGVRPDDGAVAEDLDDAAVVLDDAW